MQLMLNTPLMAVRFMRRHAARRLLAATLGLWYLAAAAGPSAGKQLPDNDAWPATEAGREIVFHKLNQRPGKPLLGAIGPRGQLVLGLPGNPMSVMVTARAIAAPLLRRLAGHAQPAPPRPAVTLAEHDGKTINLWWHRPVRLTADGQAQLIPTRGSGDLVSMARSDGFIQLPPNANTQGPWPFYRWEIDS